MQIFFILLLDHLKSRIRQGESSGVLPGAPAHYLHSINSEFHFEQGFT